MDQKLKEFCRQIKERIYVSQKKAAHETETIQRECYHPFIVKTIISNSTSNLPGSGAKCRICEKNLTAHELMKQWEELLGDS